MHSHLEKLEKLAWMPLFKKITLALKKINHYFSHSAEVIKTQFYFMISCVVKSW